jgi:phosphoribosyl-ATP pyrophosphohydrolase
MKISEAIKVLRLPAVFNAKRAKSAYRVAAQSAHPDKGGTHAAMKRVNEAYILVCAGIDFGIAPKIDVSGVDFKPYRPKPSMRAVVKWFAEQMHRKLTENRHKKFSWRKESGHSLFRKLRKECVELEEAMERRDKDDIIKECADVANFAMMIADNAKRKL